MTSKEAIEALVLGKKVRYAKWDKNVYVYLDENNLLVKSENKLQQSYGVYDKWELYEEPKKPIKVFISQPMHRRSKSEITEERNKIKKLIEAKYGEEYAIEYLNEDLWERPKDWTRIQHLGCSIMNMHEADIVVFAPDWIDAHGCFVEHDVAYFYGKKICACIKEVDGEYRLF